MPSDRVRLYQLLVTRFSEATRRRRRDQNFRFIVTLRRACVASSPRSIASVEKNSAAAKMTIPATSSNARSAAPTTGLLMLVP